MAAGQAPRTPEVTTLVVAAATVPLIEELPGRTAAYRSAQVRPQVSGIVIKRLFTEGSDVTEGQHLYQLDDAQYAVAMQSAGASREQALATEHAARRKLERYRELIGTRSISQQDFDDAEIALEQATAAVAVAEAAVATARLNLNRAKVYAPIAGRIGQSLVTEGALVTANQTQPLTVITQLDPIYVDIQQSSTDNQRLRERVRQQARVSVSIQTSAAIGAYDGTGELQFSNMTVDESTGAVQLRALFPNADHRLLPGMFVTARLDIGSESGFLLPQQAVIRNNTGGAGVWRVGGDNTVTLTTVTTTRALADKWLVTSGIHEGDVIVIEGMQRLSPDATVIAHRNGS